MTPADRPRYSIVVPTRSRHETLRSCLRTLVEQPHGNYEIVVADNASGPETRAVCESFRSPRLRYLRSDTPLSMNDNWERALDAARGEWEESCSGGHCGSRDDNSSGVSGTTKRQSNGPRGQPHPLAARKGRRRAL